MKRETPMTYTIYRNPLKGLQTVASFFSKVTYQCALSMLSICHALRSNREWKHTKQFNNKSEVRSATRGMWWASGKRFIDQQRVDQVTVLISVAGGTVSLNKIRLLYLPLETPGSIRLDSIRESMLSVVLLSEWYCLDLSRIRNRVFRRNWRRTTNLQTKQTFETATTQFECNYWLRQCVVS